MTYHDKIACMESLEEKGIEKPREFGWPLRCEIQHPSGEGEYSCPACGDVFIIRPGEPLPNGLIEQ